MKGNQGNQGKAKQRGCDYLLAGAKADLLVWTSSATNERTGRLFSTSGTDGPQILEVCMRCGCRQAAAVKIFGLVSGSHKRGCRWLAKRHVQLGANYCNQV